MAKQKITFSPQVLDLVLYSGDGNEFSLTVKDPSGSPIPLTGTMRAQIRTSREAQGPPSAVFSIDLLSEGVSGIVHISLPGDQTEDLITDSDTFMGVWDLEWTETGEEPLTIVQGKVECLRDVSR